MNGVHDLGGMHGFGPIDLGPYGQATIHADWERRLVGIEELTADRYFSLDAFRSGIERMDSGPLPALDILRALAGDDRRQPDRRRLFHRR